MTKHGMTVLFTFAALVFSTFGCGSGGGPKLTPEQKTGATAVCQKASSCGLVSSSQMGECTNQIAGALQIFPDPDKFSACINTMACSALESGDSKQLITCMDLNRDSYVCSENSTLTGCDNAGKCATISCSDVCDLMGDYTFDHCGASNDSSKAKNICWCRQ
jgi:hypothetical protein